MSKSLIIALLITLIIVIPTFFYEESRRNGLSKDELIKWSVNAHTQQFCNVIFPHLATCLTLNPDTCKTVATDAINACLDDISSSMKSYYTKEEGGEFYKKISGCFERNLHDSLMHNYVVPSEECWSRMQ